MAFLDFLFGEGEKTQQFQNYTPEQRNTLNQLLSGGTSQIPQGFDFISQILSNDPEMMQKFEAPTRRAFEEQTLPSIAERFTGMNAQKSSAFGQQLGQAGQRLEESLASQRAGRGFQALGSLQQLLGTGLTQQYENALRPRQPGALEEGGKAVMEMLPYLLMLL